MYEYEFRGVVHPQRAGMNFSKISGPVYMKDLGANGVLEFEIAKSQVYGVLKSEDDLKSFGLKYLGCIGEIVRSGVQVYVDTYGYLSGHGFNVELVEAKDVQTNEWVGLPFNIPVIAGRKNELQKRFDEITGLYVDGKAWYLQKCMSDLRNAIGSPNDTGFFCYRAIEALAGFFKKNIDDDITGSTWEEFRKYLSVDRSEIDKIKEFSDPVRHGFIVPMPTERRAEIFTATWDIVDQFIIFAKAGYGGIVPPVAR